MECGTMSLCGYVLNTNLEMTEQNVSKQRDLLSGLVLALEAGIEKNLSTLIVQRNQRAFQAFRQFA